MKKRIERIAWTLIIFGLIIIIVFLLKSYSDGYKITKESITDYEVTGQFGDFIGGVVGTFFALAGTLLIFLTFREQTNENKRIAFESSFFEMIRNHRENINELRYRKYKKNSEILYENRQVIRIIFEEFIECYREVTKFSNSKDINDYLNPKYAKKLKKITASINPKINLIELARIDIAYSIVFFGIGTEGESVLRNNFKQKYNHHYYYKLLYFIKLKPKKSNLRRYKKWKKVRDLELIDLKKLIDEIYPNRKNPERTDNYSPMAVNLELHLYYEKYYGGHQFRLGHYFRHLFQSYKYLNNNEHLSDDEKYFYGKTYRAQLSTYEQALLLINSISSVGMKWEYTPEENGAKLITKYNLIKNLPGIQLFGIRYKTYYKDIEYETNEQL